MEVNVPRRCVPSSERDDCFAFLFVFVFFARLCGLFSISIRQSWYKIARAHSCSQSLPLSLSLSLSPSHPLYPSLSLSLSVARFLAVVLWLSLAL